MMYELIGRFQDEFALAVISRTFLMCIMFARNYLYMSYRPIL